ncbi:AT-hook motif nuclear-localized protein 10-like [Glycine soja]|uniref:AT-hook motif nuclear-localized protein n=1 Tax=Glycine soja TaxID=3848 RepID=A0A445KU62_GLYSO|nr:AT-hook motif nuclear-localized protein 10-like [Glycine soja]XP_028227346.1 AT-hook motif nuclear-localized protein 10-like [Glycine soja]RZC14504.1 AT-hook motif nuclear-localized protein 10 isoform A [Glycine soja]RZC14505.1 AT-hook motif nuclear-localized protein 10 isoform B [Glycine soja]
MSGSDMASREQFTVGMHKPQPQPQQQQPQLHQNNMRMDYAAADGTAVFAPPTVTVNINGGESSPAVPPGLGLAQPQPQPQPMMVNSSEPIKRKRGRPRKYGPHGGMALALNTTTPPGGAAVPVGQSGGAFPPAPLSDSASAGTVKRRGRPRGSVNKNKKNNSSKYSGPGSWFTPHVITVKAGEDLSARIMTISQSSSRNICILTANGAISNVTLRQPASSGGTVTYEGRFEILSLGGSFFLAGTERAGGLSVSLSGPDGRVLGGGVAGLLVAASPVQIVLASFVSDVRKHFKHAKQMQNAKVSIAAGQSSSPSRGTLSESSGGVGSGSPLNQSTGACNNTMNNCTTPTQSFQGMPWK